MSRTPNVTYKTRFPEGQMRFRELLVYIAQKCEEDPAFGATKLNKLLFYADFRAFFRHGQPITGAEYQRLPRGPAPRALLPVRRELAEEGAIAQEARHTGVGEQNRVRANRDADVSLFTSSEMAIVDEVIDEFWGKNAVDVSNQSHGIAWSSRRDGDSIPYEAAYLSDEPVTDDDIARTERVLRENNISLA